MMRERLAGSVRVLSPLWRLCLAAVVAAGLMMLIIGGITTPIRGGNDDYSADFTDTSGLRPNADVRIRGVKVGKVTAIDLEQDATTNSVRSVVSFTLDKNHRVTGRSTAAVKYANLSGVRYLDLANVDGSGNTLRHIGLENTTPSFNITRLFNGLQPVLQTLSTDEINRFTENALTVLQGDGSGLGPMLASVDKLSRYTTDRGQVISALVTNMSRISDTLGGKSPQIVQFLREMETPIDAANSVLDEFRKAATFGPPFMRQIDHLLQALGLEQGREIDRQLSEAFPTIDDAWKSLRLLPSMIQSIQLPAVADGKDNRCSKGRLDMPGLAQVLVNGVGVSVCRG